MSELVLNFNLNFNFESLDDDNHPPGRFKSLTAEEVNRIAEGRNEKSTMYNTSWGIKILKEWCVAKGYDASFEIMEAAALNTLLRGFYAEVRNKKGERYAKQSFVGLRAAIHRHLTGEPYCRQMNIMNDREFRGANNVFTGVLKQLKKAGLDQSKAKCPIAPGDLKKISKIGTDNPRGLLQMTWFFVEYFFCRRGREGLRQLSGDSFQFHNDDDGNEYCTSAYKEATKNHPGDLKRDNEPHKRMYASGGSICPVATLKKYLSHRNPKCGALFQRPSTSPKGTVWYANGPLGKNVLGTMMKEISKSAGLSQVYTNHCIRATVITELNRHGFDSRTITTLSGHRNEASISSYCTDSSTLQKRNMSATLSECLNGSNGNANNNNSSSSSNTSAIANVNLSSSVGLSSPNVNHDRPSTSTGSTSSLSIDSSHNTKVEITEKSSVVTQNLSRTGLGSIFSNCSFSGSVKVYMPNTITE